MEATQSEFKMADPFALTDVILPSQFYDTSEGLGAEQRLMLAVLADAINLVQGWNGTGSPRKRQAFAEARHWAGTRGTGHPFSFDSICDALVIDAEILRTRLLGHSGGHASPARARNRRLRLKDSGRAQHMTANRVRPRKHAKAATMATILN